MSERGSAPAAENKMGTMPVGKLVFNMSLPMMVSMLVQALYNIVDSIFVAKLSENALTDVSLDCRFIGFSASDTSDCGSYRYRCRHERTPFQVPGRAQL